MSKKIKSKSFGLFIISIVILIFIIVLASLWESLKLGDNKIPLAITLTITFGISIAGFILGVTEIKNGKKARHWIGSVGNILVILFFILMVYLGSSY